MQQGYANVECHQVIKSLNYVPTRHAVRHVSGRPPGDRMSSTHKERLWFSIRRHLGGCWVSCYLPRPRNGTKLYY